MKGNAFTKLVLRHKTLPEKIRNENFKYKRNCHRQTVPGRYRVAIDNRRPPSWDEPRDPVSRDLPFYLQYELRTPFVAEEIFRNIAIKIVSRYSFLFNNYKIIVSRIRCGSLILEVSLKQKLHYIHLVQKGSRVHITV